MSETVFVDTSAFYALFNPRDQNHKVAGSCLVDLHRRSVALMTTNLVLFEAYVLVHARTGRRGLLRFRDVLAKSRWLRRVVVDAACEGQAWKLLERESDKDYSLVDAVSFVVMRANKIESAFAFDAHFRQAGFEPVTAGSRR